MNLRKLHTYVGLTLVIPFVCWIATAMVFYLKPGYDAAYEFLQVKSYPLDSSLVVKPDSRWMEYRVVRTVLGSHLLARTEDGWQNLDPLTHKPLPFPEEASFRKLVGDALSSNPARYGAIRSISHDSVFCSTGVLVTMNWKRMSLQQYGNDTRIIDLLYKIHYLQWTGNPAIDKILGPVGLALVFTLSMIGLILAFRRT